MTPREELELRRRIANGDPAAIDAMNAAKMGAAEAAARSAGWSFANIGSGIAEMIGLDPDRPLGGGPKLPGWEHVSQEAIREEHPIASAVGESAPYIVGGLGTGAALKGVGGAVKGGKFLANVAGQAGTAGAIGAVQPGDLEERLTRGAWDAALGAGGEVIGQGLGRVIAPGFRRVADDQISRAEDLGFKALPSSRAGAPQFTKNMIEGGLEVMPGSSIHMGQIASHNQDLLNRIAGQALGIPDGQGGILAEAPTGPMLAEARKRAGHAFESIMSKDRKIWVRPDDIERLNAIESAGVAPFIRGEADPIGEAVKRMREHMEGKSMTGADVMSLQSRLGKQGRQAFRGETSNPDLGHALLDLRDLLLDMASRSMPDADRAVFNKARETWRVLSVLERGSITNGVTGDVSALQLANNLQRMDPKGFLEEGNKSPLYEAVRFMGRAQKPNRSSGTAERLALTGAVGGGAGGAILAGDENKLETAGGAALVGLGLPYGMARAYTSPAARNYMTRSAGLAEQQATRAVGLGTARSMKPEEKNPLVEKYGRNQLQVADEALTWIITEAENRGALRLARDARLAQRRGTPEEYQRIRKMLGGAIKELVRQGDMQGANDLSASYQALNVEPLE